MTALIIFLIIIVLIFAWFVMIYNKLVQMIEEIKNNHKQIDIQLDRRYKVFQSLIEVVKQYMDYEKSTLKDVIALRSKAESAKQSGDEKTRMESENAISKILSGINLVFEQYPDLKANSNAMQLQEEIVNTENKLAYAKQAFNDSIERYNATKKSFFESMVLGFNRAKLDQHFEYWGLSEEKIAEQEKYTVKF